MECARRHSPLKESTQQLAQSQIANILIKMLHRQTHTYTHTHNSNNNGNTGCDGKKEVKGSQRRGGIPLEMFHKLNIYAAAGQQLRHANLSSISSSNINKKKEQQQQREQQAEHLIYKRSQVANHYSTRLPGYRCPAAALFALWKGAAKVIPFSRVFLCIPCQERVAGLPKEV